MDHQSVSEAVLASIAIVGWLRAWYWHRSYRAALRLFAQLPKAPERTPHQRGAETRKARELARKRAHREDMQRSMMEAQP